MTQALRILPYEQLDEAVRLHLGAVFPERYYAQTELPLHSCSSIATLKYEGLTFSVGKWEEIQADARLYHVALLTEVHTSCKQTGPILELLMEAGVVFGKCGREEAFKALGVPDPSCYADRSARVMEDLALMSKLDRLHVDRQEPAPDMIAGKTAEGWATYLLGLAPRLRMQELQSLRNQPVAGASSFYALVKQTMDRMREEFDTEACCFQVADALLYEHLRAHGNPVTTEYPAEGMTRVSLETAFSPSLMDVPTVQYHKTKTRLQLLDRGDKKPAQTTGFQQREAGGIPFNADGLDSTITFHCGTDEKACGTLRQKDGKLHFDGNLTPSAQVLFAQVCRMWNKPEPVSKPQTPLPVKGYIDSAHYCGEFVLTSVGQGLAYGLDARGHERVISGPYSFGLEATTFNQR